MDHEPGKGQEIEQVSLPLNSDLFFRSVIRELCGTLEDVVGLEEASGFISVVGQRIGEEFNSEYKTALGRSEFGPHEISRILVDLKKRIGGDFSLIEATEDKLVFGNTRCPFGKMVIGRKSLCMMTANVFGSITAANHGRAKVAIEQAIAVGDPGCRVVVHLKPTKEAESAEGRDFFRGEQSVAP